MENQNTLDNKKILKIKAIFFFIIGLVMHYFISSYMIRRYLGIQPNIKDILLYILPTIFVWNTLYTLENTTMEYCDGDYPLPPALMYNGVLIIRNSFLMLLIYGVLFNFKK